MGGNGGELTSNARARARDEIRIPCNDGIHIVNGVILTIFNVCGVRHQQHCDVEGLPLPGIDGYNSGQGDCSHTKFADGEVCTGNICKGNRVAPSDLQMIKFKLTCQRNIRSRNGIEFYLQSWPSCSRWFRNQNDCPSLSIHAQLSRY